jgi:hypothetical protein
MTNLRPHWAVIDVVVRPRGTRGRARIKGNAFNVMVPNSLGILRPLTAIALVLGALSVKKAKFVLSAHAHEHLLKPETLTLVGLAETSYCPHASIRKSRLKFLLVVSRSYLMPASNVQICSGNPIVCQDGVIIGACLR